MKEHTEGPWYTTSKAIPNYDLQVLVCSELTGGNIAITYDVRDAALIAAAPDMLAALEELVSLLDNEDTDFNHDFMNCGAADHCILCYAKAAISKARWE